MAINNMNGQCAQDMNEAQQSAMVLVHVHEVVPCVLIRLCLVLVC